MPKITKKIIESAAFQQKKYYIWDTDVKGFGCLIYPSGKKTYVYYYYTKGGIRKKEYVKIGLHGSITCELAREVARGWAGDLARGIDPKERKKEEIQSIKFQDFFQIFTERHRLIEHKKSSINRDNYRIKNHILPFFGNMKMNEITEKDIVRFKDHLKHIPVTYNRSMNLIQKALSLAELWDFRPKNTNPCRGIKKYPEKKKERFLTNEELEKLDSILKEQEALGATSPYSLAAIRMLLYTGCRLGEVLNLKWEDVKFDEGYLHLKDAKGGEVTIPLNESAKKILSNLSREPANPYVFIGSKSGQCLTTLKTAWTKIRRLAEIEDVRIHDLRHTFASLAIKQGVDLYTVSKLLGHRNIRTTTRYAHLEVQQLIKATNVVDQVWQNKNQ
jgi:integrase